MIKYRCFILVLGMAVCTPSYAEEKFQTLDSIYAFVKNEITQKMNPAAEFEITVLPLDNQLKLPKCTEPLETFKIDDLIKAGRASIGVRCNSDKRWSIFVSAVIKAYESVIVLTRPVQRGDIITRQHLSVEKKDVSSTRGDFVTELERVENKEAARNLPAGAILGSKSVVEPPLIKRKDKVIISTGGSSFSVQMDGTALMDGAKGQVIKVKNESSGRIISGTVIEPGLVLVK